MSFDLSHTSEEEVTDPVQLIQWIGRVDEEPEILRRTVIHVQRNQPEARSNDSSVESTAFDRLTRLCR